MVLESFVYFMIKQKRYDIAEEAMTRSIELASTVYGHAFTSPSVVTLMNNYGVAFLK